MICHEMVDNFSFCTRCFRGFSESEIGHIEIDLTRIYVRFWLRIQEHFTAGIQWLFAGSNCFYVFEKVMEIGWLFRHLRVGPTPRNLP